MFEVPSPNGVAQTQVLARGHMTGRGAHAETGSHYGPGSRGWGGGGATEAF